MAKAIPEVDMMSVAKSCQVQRRAVLGFVPKIGLPIVDYADVERIDTFYLECQKYRDFYRDPYDKVHKPDLFKNRLGQCGIKLDTSVDALRQPVLCVPRRQPLIDPINYGSDMNLGVDMGQIFKGKYSKNTCFLYKR